MNATQLEGLVLRAVDAVRKGGQPEDDRVEFKREWPQPEKARQLAAAANQAHGDHIIYVIGVDERDGSIHRVNGTDPATWWAQIESRFDEISPDLALNINVHVSTGEQVVALLFRTDRAPYVVKVQNGGAIEREVPIRAGTRTRSAKRHELIRLLYPAASVPGISLLSGVLYLEPPDPYRGDHGDAHMLRVLLEVLFEHSGVPTLATYHDSSVEVRSGKHVWRGAVYARPPANSGPDNAIHVRHDGLRIAETGVAFVQAMLPIASTPAARLRDAAECRVDFELGIVGASRRPAATVMLSRNAPPQVGQSELASWGWSIRE